MQVLLLSRYGRLGASSRMRHYQFLPLLESAGIGVVVAPLLPDAYLEALYAGRRPPLGAILSGYRDRLARLLDARRFDVLWIEKETLPWAPFAMERALLDRAPPVVIDIDDAWHLRYGAHRSRAVRGLLGGKIDRLLRRAALVVAGNRHLADHARAAGAARVEIVPTVVDSARYPVRAPAARERPVVGWIGTPGTAPLLDLIREPLARGLAEGRFDVRLVGAGGAALAGLACERLAWSEDAEADAIASMDIGVMPLPDAPWERGKCGYKLIQYMACARPVIASPVGANRDIVAHGEDGFLAESAQEWSRALAALAADPDLRARFGAAGRAKVERLYALDRAAPRLAELLRGAAALQRRSP